MGGAGGDRRPHVGETMRARMTAIFGNATKGMRAASLGPVKFERDDPLYVSTLRTRPCDVAGSPQGVG
jgi:hypothetical protein